MKYTAKITCLIVCLMLVNVLSLVKAENEYDASTANYSNAEAVKITLPEGYASDAWLQSGNGVWADEIERRERELYTYLRDTDPARAEEYGFREGHTPALAWNWFDQHPVGFGGIPYVLLQTLLSLDPATETNEHLLALANIWKKESVIADEQGQDLYTLDHLGFGPHPADYENGVAKSLEDRRQKLPNGFVYDPNIEPESVFFVERRLKIMRDGRIVLGVKSLDQDDPS